VTICPCCGFRFEGDLKTGCEACGARAVGDPLPKPERELPAYGRPLLLAATGILMILGFLAQTVMALAQRVPLSFGFWSWIAAAETAAWRLKWISIPVTFCAVWGGHRIYQSMMETPELFVGLRRARQGLMASALVSLMILTLIAVTVPARVRQRRTRIEAGLAALGYTYDRALLEYRARYGTLPTDLNNLRDLPDPDGSIAAALAALGDGNLSDYQGYKTSSIQMAELPKKKPAPLRGAALLNASVNLPADDPPGGVLVFTDYELRLPGEDKILGTEDDLVVRDGVVMKASEVKEPTPRVTAPIRPGKR
jgi:hypothetical protein